VKHGIDEVIINLHYLSNEIRKALGEGKEWGIKIRYSIEEHPLGTAGAVKNAEEYFGDEPLVIFNGDVLTDINISKIINFHAEKKATVTLALTEVEDPTPFGLVLIDKEGRVGNFIEKPSWSMVTAKTINAGIYIVDPKIFKNIPVGKPYSFERNLYPELLEQGAPIYGYLSNAYWIDIGNPEKYKEVHQAIMRGEVAVKIFGTRVDGKFWLGKDTHPEASSRFVGPSIVGERVKFGKETEIKDFVVLGDGVEIGDRCVLDRVIVWKGTKIGSHVLLSDCIIGSNCVIEDGAAIRAGAVLASGTVIKRGTKC
jgi:mannose-1-phosphate guanylyltransferase/phosphomannomutase